MAGVLKNPQWHHEVRAWWEGMHLAKVEYCDANTGEVVDLTGCSVTGLERDVVLGDVPLTKVVMRARLVEVEPGPSCQYCGLLGWTLAKHGKALHKHACPRREQAPGGACQTHPHGCPR